jgi:uncharacterized protein YkwD
MSLRLNFNTSLFLSLLFFILTLPGCSGQPHSTARNPEIKSPSVAPLEEEILGYVNEYRLSRNLPILQSNDIISAEAEMHSFNMASKKVPFSHDGFEERVQNINTKFGITRASAENVAYGKISARQAVDFWLKSAGHHKNIVGNYAFTGVGISRNNEGTIFFTQIFISR